MRAYAHLHQSTHLMPQRNRILRHQCKSNVYEYIYVSVCAEQRTPMRGRIWGVRLPFDDLRGFVRCLFDFTPALFSKLKRTRERIQLPVNIYRIVGEKFTVGLVIESESRSKTKSQTHLIISHIFNIGLPKHPLSDPCHFALFALSRSVFLFFLLSNGT